jgi:uncharacterized repeat protein (TIGR02543 family)
MRKIITMLCCALIFAACAGLEDDRDTYAVTFVATYYGITGTEKWGDWEKKYDDWHPEWKGTPEGIGKDDDGNVIGDIDVWGPLLEFRRLEQTNPVGRLPNIPSPPPRENYEFQGWFTSGGTPVTILTVFTSDAVVYAKWKRGGNGETFEDGPLALRLKEIPNLVSQGGAISFSRTVPVNANETLLPQTLDYGGRRVHVILDGVPTNGIFPIISVSGMGSLFTVGENVTLELRNIWLRGGGRNPMALLSVNAGGRLIIGQNKQDRTRIFNNGSEDMAEGGAVTVWTGGEFIMNGGELTDNNSYNTTREIGYWGIGGSGVMVRGGTFTMNGGSMHRNGSVDGTVMVFRDGKFIMNDGEIYDNSASTGGGVHIFRSGLFEMYGGKIHHNLSVNGGGVFVNRGLGTIRDPFDPRRPPNVKGTPGYDASKPENDPLMKEGFYMYGGEIYSNGCSNSGGGIYNTWGSYTYMAGGTVYGNTGWVVAGVHNFGLFVMKDGIITGNKGSYGGGVFAGEGRFVMEGGQIVNNEASMSGGGVTVAEYFLMFGGTISGNSTSEYGGGVLIQTTGQFSMSGGTIEGNTADRDGTGTIYFLQNNTVDTDAKGTAFYGIRDGDYDAIIPHGYTTKEIDEDTGLPTDTDVFIITSDINPYGDGIKIEIKNGEMYIDNSDTPEPRPTGS